ncbi:MAG: ABC transporter substrate-binding protein [Pseudolabrys sp.]|nr:ABC transporter substrate-binding protein [Pseudolabrys sp.]MDP2296033.1 ABC transporter substrate-binding protein [Pseudolabrys sp.]
MATAVVAIAVVFWSGADKGGGVLSNPASVSLRLNGSYGSKYAGEIVAVRANIFERNGIDLELRESGQSIDPIASVVSGSDTFGVTNSISFLNARAAGQPIVAFAAGFLENSIVFYALEKSGIRAPQDFIGKRVGRRSSTDSAVLYDALLKNTGLSRSQIRESATETDLDALLNDRVDVVSGRIGLEGFLLRQKGVPYTVIRVSDYGIHVPDTVYFTTEKLVSDRPSLVQRVLQGILAGWAMTYADTAKSVPLIVAAGKNLTPEQVQFELAAQRDFVMPLGRRVAEFDEQQWKQLRAILTSARLMDGSVDLKRAINYDILKEAYRKPISFGN